MSSILYNNQSYPNLKNKPQLIYLLKYWSKLFKHMDTEKNGILSEIKH
jgi:hypothetical protein